MAGITLFEDDFPYILTGDYRVVLVETDEWGDKGKPPTSIIFRLRIAEPGSEQGKSTATWCGLNPGEGTARQWKAALTSFGYKAEALETTMQPEASWFGVGKEAYIHIESPPLSEGKKITSKDVDVKFISPATYLKRKQEQKLAGSGSPPPGASPGFTPSSPPPGLPTPPVASAQPLAAPLPPGGPQPGASLFGQPPAPANGPAPASAQTPAPSGPPPMA
jgi:hypothetical protein